AFQWRTVSIGNRPGAARHRLAAEPCGAAAPLVQSLHEVGVVKQVAMRCGLRRPLELAAAKRGDAAQAVTDVEGVGDLAELAVTDAVDAGRNLLLDDLAHLSGETSVERCRLERSPGFARLQEFQQLGQPRQASDMGSKNSLDACLHPGNPTCASWLGSVTSLRNDRARRGSMGGKLGEIDKLWLARAQVPVRLVAAG